MTLQRVLRLFPYKSPGVRKTGLKLEEEDEEEG
jgi:hypothetical protein